MKIRDYIARQKEDPRWAGAGGYRYLIFKSFPLDEVAYVIRNKETHAIVGRFKGPNVFFHRADAEKYLHGRRYYKDGHGPGYVDDEVVPVRIVQMAEDAPMDLRGKLRQNMTEDERASMERVKAKNSQTAQAAADSRRKRQAFRAGDMDGRWASPEIEAFFNHTMSFRLKRWRERTDEMFRRHLENQKTMRPGQQCTNLELVRQEFAYIDRMLEQLYVDHFISAHEVIHIRDKPIRGLTTIMEERKRMGVHAPNCNISEKLSDVCSCGVYDPVYALPFSIRETRDGVDYDTVHKPECALAKSYLDFGLSVGIKGEGPPCDCGAEPKPVKEESR